MEVKWGNAGEKLTETPLSVPAHGSGRAPGRGDYVGGQGVPSGRIAQDLLNPVSDIIRDHHANSDSWKKF
jgi:hypothetical protein